MESTATVTKRTKMRMTKGDVVFTICNYIFVILAVVITLYPLIYVLSASISEPTKVNSGAMWLWPVDITFTGYKRVFSDPDIWSGYANTIFYTVFGTLINLVLTIPCAYALAKKHLPFKKGISFIILFTMFFSGGLIPLYMLVDSLHLLDTVWAVVLPTAASAYNIIISRTFMETTIPEGLEEAAEIDGCDPFRTFFKIILPLSAPIIAVMALFYGVGHWNSYFNEMIFLTSHDKLPLQVILREIIVVTQLSSSGNVTNMEAQTAAEMQQLSAIIKYAVMIVSSLPIIIVYPFLQRFFVKGVMIGSIKG